MKSLQGTQEERWQFRALGLLDGVIRRPSHPTEVFLLLHGLHERGKRIYRKIIPALPENALVLAPNGPFPLPRERSGSYGHAWYFYDRSEKKYLINQDLARSWLCELLKIENPHHLPLTIIGFSQGGYLAPLLASDIPETKKVIGIGCEFRSQLITQPPRAKLIALHGADDQIIKPEWALEQIALLKERNIPCDWHLIEGAGHEITPSMVIRIKELLNGA